MRLGGSGGRNSAGVLDASIDHYTRKYHPGIPGFQHPLILNLLIPAFCCSTQQKAQPCGLGFLVIEPTATTG
jgi:hypothetical protein